MVYDGLLRFTNQGRPGPSLGRKLGSKGTEDETVETKQEQKSTEHRPWIPIPRFDINFANIYPENKQIASKPRSLKRPRPDQSDDEDEDNPGESASDTDFKFGKSPHLDPSQFLFPKTLAVSPKHATWLFRWRARIRDNYLEHGADWHLSSITFSNHGTQLTGIFISPLTGPAPFSGKKLTTTKELGDPQTVIAEWEKHVDPSWERE
jgi:hypothetical protein